MFSSESASGNPCGVLELDSWLSDEELQKITCDAELPVTSFIINFDGQFYIRWFAMDGEINLCGHGSLGAGAAIISKYNLDSVLFSSKYGDVSIAKNNGIYTLELPSWKGETCSIPTEISDIAVDAIDVFSTRDLVLVLPSIESVRNFQPDDMRFKQLSKYHALIVTAANGENGYVLRYFAPKIGISEDLATGSAQCSLAPYWFDKLNSDSLQVHQLSSSGGYFGVQRISADSIVLLANAKLRK
ncbi:PhzF family phenazine biosynthesis protein [Photobacterium sp. Ph6]|uniref:PhzF family phenazine biosynthesis protein n=1 Tax=unclassified Photobacterium TaxID=2628852 RepID=UPI0031F8F853|nr:PhzF family phenazine biosynthesis protein [Photobacterium sp. Ph6]MCG3875328.1 PhzF family phenazine biosynthesis protein [Photobacterium sp. Ph5]